jgi:hypothetical protein
MSGGSGGVRGVIFNGFASPVLSRKRLKNIGFEGMPNYLSARGAHMSQTGPLLNAVQNINSTLVKATKVQAGRRRTALPFR